MIGVVSKTLMTFSMLQNVSSFRYLINVSNIITLITLNDIVYAEGGSKKGTETFVNDFTLYVLGLLRTFK